MRSRLRYLAATPLFLLFVTACPSITNTHTARPIGPGNFELAAVPLIQGVAGGVDSATGSELDAIGWPWFEFAMRYGLNEMMDFGVKYIPPLQVSGDLNIALVNVDGFALSLDPTLQPWGIFAEDSGALLLWAFLPVLVDVVGSETFALTLNAKPGLLYASATAETGGDREFESGVTYVVGGGAAIKIMFTDRFGIMPGLDILYSFDTESFWFTAAVGFMFTL